MIIDVPVKDANGVLQFTATLDEKQTQAILQFGLNFLMATGLSAAYGVVPVEQQVDLGQLNLPLND